MGPQKQAVKETQKVKKVPDSNGVSNNQKDTPDLHHATKEALKRIESMKNGSKRKTSNQNPKDASHPSPDVSAVVAAAASKQASGQAPEKAPQKVPEKAPKEASKAQQDKKTQQDKMRMRSTHVKPLYDSKENIIKNKTSSGAPKSPSSPNRDKSVDNIEEKDKSDDDYDVFEGAYEEGFEQHRFAPVHYDN